MEHPLITIGLSCYNAADTIPKAIDCAQKQDWPNLEFVIVDDGSKDNSVEVIKEIAKNEPRLRLIVHETNKWFPGALNTILKEAKGEFIAFFDDDDESVAERVSTQYKRITDYEAQTGESLIACFCSGDRIYPNGYTVELEAIGSKGKVPHGEDVAQRLLYFGGPSDMFFGTGTPTCSLMARKSTFIAAGGYDETIRRASDAEFAIRLGLKGGHFIGCTEKLLIQHSTESPDKSQEIKRDATLAIVEKHRPYLETKGMYRYARDWQKIRYCNFAKKYPEMFARIFYLSLFYPVKVWSHLMKTGPARIKHERKMSA